jgi:hypothetical protein
MDPIQYINDDLRNKCYLNWVGVRRCATNIMGESFSTKLNISRTLEKDAKVESYNQGDIVEKTMELLSKELRYSPAPEEGII